MTNDIRWTMEDEEGRPRRPLRTAILQTIFQQDGDVLVRIGPDGENDRVSLADLVGEGDDPRAVLNAVYLDRVTRPAKNEALEQARIVGSQLLNIPNYQPEPKNFSRGGSALDGVVYYNTLSSMTRDLAAELDSQLAHDFDRVLAERVQPSAALVA